MIKENYEEYIVEFRITIVDPTYSKLLRDPEGPQYNEIKREITDKVRVRCDFPDPQKMFVWQDVGMESINYPGEQCLPQARSNIQKAFSFAKKQKMWFHRLIILY